MGGEERVERQHASGRLTVRERIERLFDEGTFHETGALAGRGTYGERRRADRVPAREHDRRPGPHRRAPRGRAGRRLHRPRRRRRRRDLGEGRLRRAPGARPAPPARPARGRHGRRRQRQDARADGLLLRAAAAGLRPRREEPLDRARGGRGARTGGGPRRGARGLLALLGDRRGTRRSCSWPAHPWSRWPAWARRPTRRSSAGRACRRARAPWTTSPPTRTTRSRSSSAFSPTCRTTSGRRRRSSTRAIPPTAARRRSSRSSRATPASPYKMRRVLEAVLDRDSVFELGAAFGRPTITCLARLGGRPVGVLASDPEHYGGGVTADAAEKTARFVDMCDQFHLPVVNFVDVPGFVIGTARSAPARSGAARAACSRRCRPRSRGCRSSCARSTGWRAPATATARG